MTAKLTLRIDSDLIKSAKLYASNHQKSVSQMVADYFGLLDQTAELRKHTLLPVTGSLRGVLKNSDISEHDYKQYLEDKYL